MIRLYPHHKTIRRHMSKMMLSYGSTVKLSYQKYGVENGQPDTTPIFILHGLLGCKKDWANFGKTISNITKRSVVTVDLRNHGDSGHAKTNRYPELAQDMLRLFKKLSVTRASIVGHNMGARACMCLALAEPDIVASILIFDMSPVSTCQEFMTVYPVVLRAMLTMNFVGETHLSTAVNKVKKEMKHFVPDDYTMNSVLRNLQIIKKTGSIGWRCDPQVLLDEFQHIASFPQFLKNPYMGPALFIGGQLSDYLPPDDLTAIRERFPSAVIIYVPQTTHFLHLEAPSSVLELSIKFLDHNT